jgi:hypothetical protein
MLMALVSLEAAAGNDSARDDLSAWGWGRQGAAIADDGDRLTVKAGLNRQGIGFETTHGDQGCRSAQQRPDRPPLDGPKGVAVA